MPVGGAARAAPLLLRMPPSRCCKSGRPEAPRPHSTVPANHSALADPADPDLFCLGESPLSRTSDLSDIRRAKALLDHGPRDGTPATTVFRALHGDALPCQWPKARWARSPCAGFVKHEHFLAFAIRRDSCTREIQAPHGPTDRPPLRRPGRRSARLRRYPAGGGRQRRLPEPQQALCVRRRRAGSDGRHRHRGRRRRQCGTTPAPDSTAHRGGPAGRRRLRSPAA